MGRNPIDQQVRTDKVSPLPYGDARKRFVGVFANLPTALTDDGDAIDEMRIRHHVQWLLDSGVHGVSCLLNSGEFTYLDPDERERVVRCVVQACGGRIPVIAGVTGDTTQASIAFAQAASAAGADVVALQPRSLIPLKPVEVIRHYESVAAKAGAPIGIYNHPASTGVAIGPKLYGDIVEASGAVVTKDASGDLLSIPKIVNSCGEMMDYLMAEEGLVLAGLAMGARGCCLAMASVFPKEFVSLYGAVDSGQMDKARSIYNRLIPAFEIFSEIGRPRVVKVVAELRGFPLGGHRSPVLGVTPAERAHVRRTLEAMEVM